ncbi:MAG TPA: SDR family oxidoreductase, partial [Acetobacteraceae bacterium]
ASPSRWARSWRAPTCGSIASRPPLFAQMTQEHIDFMRSKIPLGRFGEIDEIASLVCWLASEECSFSTGGVFDISGGRATY